LAKQDEVDAKIKGQGEVELSKRSQLESQLQISAETTAKKVRDIADAEYKLEKVEEKRNQLKSQLDTVWSQLNDKENKM